MKTEEYDVKGDIEKAVENIKGAGMPVHSEIHVNSKTSEKIRQITEEVFNGGKLPRGRRMVLIPAPEGMTRGGKKSRRRIRKNMWVPADSVPAAPRRNLRSR